MAEDTTPLPETAAAAESPSVPVETDFGRFQYFLVEMGIPVTTHEWPDAGGMLASPYGPIPIQWSLTIPGCTFAFNATGQYVGCVDLRGHGTHTRLQWERPV
jgi:hypothetical protein